MKSFIGDCHEDMMVDLHRRHREKGDSKLKFQVEIDVTFFNVVLVFRLFRVSSSMMRI